MRRAEASRPVVAVTGATGFIGRRLIPQLHAAGYQPRILVRREPAGADWSGCRIELVPGALEDAGALDRLVRGASAVIHLAGLVKAAQDRDFQRVNVVGTQRVVDAVKAHGVAHLLLVSSLAARAPQLSAYAHSKRAAEDLAFGHLPQRLSVLRPPAVYGPGDRETLAFFQLARWPGVPLLGGPQARMAVVHVDDLCAAMRSVLRSGPTAQVQVPSDERFEGYGWAEIMDAAAQAVGRSGYRVVQVPAAAIRALGHLGDLLRPLVGARMLTSGKARELLYGNWGVGAGERYSAPDWRPQFALYEGFADAVRAYRSAGWL